MILLTYIRLVEGGRLQRDRRERVQRDAGGAPGAAQNDHKRRVERLESLSRSVHSVCVDLSVRDWALRVERTSPGYHMHSRAVGLA